jgi:alanine racemase
MRPCWVEICTRSVEDNYRFLEGLAAPDIELMAIVKADAYGHSLDLCAPAAVRAGARWLGVTSVEEGVAARAACPTTRIVVIGGVFPGQGPQVLERGLTPVAWDIGQLDELESAAHAAAVLPGALPVHLEIDTGMSRQGVAPGELGPVLARFRASSPLRLEAVMTHLYASDEADGGASGHQLEQLDEALEQIEKARAGLATRPEWLSVGASAALLGPDAAAIAALAQRQGLKTMLRPGLALYGLAPRFCPAFEHGREPAALSAARAGLKPVLAWKTRVASVRTVPAGAEIGYNGTFVATEPMRLALVAVGYADGLDRRLGNRFSLLVRGQRAPVVGRISMDQTVLDITEIPGVAPGDEVVILGHQGADAITAFDHAAAAQTIPWEVFTRIGPRVRRVQV